MQCRHCAAEITVHDSDFGKIDECRHCAKDVEKYAGHMVWDHKTAPALEIHASKRSLEVLKKGRYNEGLDLRVEVKERARRRESDVSDSGICLSPFIRGNSDILDKSGEDLPEIQIRLGRGKTIVTFGRSLIEKIPIVGSNHLSHLNGEKLLLAKSVAKIKLSKIGGSSITVWKDDGGYYVIPKKSEIRSVLDYETQRSLGFRTSNYSR